MDRFWGTLQVPWREPKVKAFVQGARSASRGTSDMGKALAGTGCWGSSHREFGPAGELRGCVEGCCASWKHTNRHVVLCGNLSAARAAGSLGRNGLRGRSVSGKSSISTACSGRRAGNRRILNKEPKNVEGWPPWTCIVGTGTQL